MKLGGGQTKKLIDCFLFNDELEFLEFRLKELNDVVDYFVLVEARKRFNGTDKPLYFQENKKLFEPYLNKILNVIVEDVSNDVETLQTNSIKLGLNYLKLNSDDIIIISDIYHVINSKIIESIKDYHGNYLFTLSMDGYVYNFNCCVNKSDKTRMINYGNVSNFPNIIDIKRTDAPIIDNSGWYLYWFHSMDKITQKLKIEHNEILSDNDIKKAVTVGIRSGIHLIKKDVKIHIDFSENKFLPKNWESIKNLVPITHVFTPKMKQTYNVYHNLLDAYCKNSLPVDHISFLENLKNVHNFNPKVCYDIGSCVLHWTREVENIWKDTQVVLFDAFSPVDIFYQDHLYHIGVLSNEDNKQVKFYQNSYHFGGNSYYREDSETFPEDTFTVKSTRTLDTVVKEKNFPLPDMIKIDVQGAELDILKGAKSVLTNCKVLIIELQNVQYNLGAPLADVTIDFLKDLGWECIARKFSDNGPDGDYCFMNTKII